MDTNVLISGAFYSGPPLQILQACMDGEFQLAEPICRDPQDDKFIACALAVDAEVIVSGDKDLLAVSDQLSDQLTISVMQLREFVDRFISKGN